MKTLLLVTVLAMTGCATTYPAPDVVPVGQAVTESGKGLTVGLSGQNQESRGVRWCLYREKFVIYKVKSIPMTKCQREIKLI